MSAWQEDKKWSDKFIADIKPILGMYLIGEPPVEEDQSRNTDLMVLKMDSVRIGCRIRKYSYLNNYSGEFTIRSARQSGHKTEITKIIEGWGDYFFYGFCNDDESGLAFWTLANMNVFRLHFCRYLVSSNGAMLGTRKNNADGKSGFRVFNWTDFPQEFIVAQHETKKETTCQI